MKTLITSLILLLITTSNSYAVIDSMQLRGHGNVYYLSFIKVYKASLLTIKDADTLNILDPGISKCLKLEYDVSLTSENFIEGADTVLGRQYSAEQLNTLQQEIEALHNAYQPVEKGDIYRLCYNSDNATTTLTLNGKDLVSITSQEFSSVYFGIWLSPDKPIDKKLQRNLVAGNN
jgi:hypothetical protein